MTQPSLGRVLVVDDETEFLKLLCEMLSRIGYEPVPHSASRDALEALKKQPFEIILADLKMPEMDGIELLQATREIDPYLVGIIITGHGSVGTAVEAMKAGAFDYLMKPIEFGMLAPVLSRAMNMRRLQKENLRLRELHKNLIDGAQDVIYSLSPEGVFTSLNPAFEAITGWSQSDWLGKEFTDILHPDDLPIALRMFERVKRGDTPPPFELRVRSRTGEYLIGEFVTPPQIIGGKIVAILGIARDITKRKAAEQLLFESEERFRRLSEAAFEGIAISEEGTLVDCNSRLAGMFGYSISEITERKIIEFIAPESRDFVMKQILSGSEEPYEFFAIKKDGSTFPAEAKAKSIPHDGKTLKVTAIQDVTQRRETERQLSMMMVELNTQMAISDAIFNNTPSGILVVNKEGRILTINLSGAEILKVAPGEVFGKDLGDLYAEMREMLIVGQDIGRESAVTLPDGSTLPIGFTNGALRDKDGSVMGTIIVFRDLTEIKQLQAEVRKKQHFEALGKIISGVAHEIRNPLFAIQSIAQLLERDMESPQHQALIKAVLKETSRMRHLVEELLLYSRPSKLAVVDVDLDLFLEELKNTPSAKQCDINLSSALHQVKILKADKGKLMQVFLNLIDNSVGADSSAITVTVTKKADAVIVSLKDNGTGIKERDMERLFEPFFTTKKDGTGLGLPLCKKIIEEHGGTIEIESEEGKGTTAIMTFPD